MSDSGMSALLQLSDAIVAATGRAAPVLTAIRVGPNRHISGFIWSGNLIVTSDQALPAQDSYSVVLASGALAPARPGPRDASADLAALLLDATVQAPVLPRCGPVAPGSLALALGTGFDGSPGVRMAVVHRVEQSNGGVASIILDMPPAQLSQGGPVLDAAGALMGMGRIGSQGEASVLPHALIAQRCDGTAQVAEQPAAPPLRVALGPRRGWLGLALQPITVPDTLASRAGQASARMVVSVTAGGPAERAGLRVGDVLLALNGHTTSGSHALRAFLGADRIGAQVEVRLLRDGTVLTTQLTVAAQPAP